MRLLSRLPFRFKLVAVAMMTTAAALFVTFIAETVTDLVVFQRDVAQNLVTLAKITGENSRSAIVFGDTKAASGVLRSLQARPDILAGFILTPDAAIFAEYRSERIKWDRLPPSSKLGRPVPQMMGDYKVEDGHMDIAQPIMLDGEWVGTLYLQASLAEAADEVVWRNSAWGASLIAILVGTYFLAARLQRLVSRPILDLATTAQEVTREGNYSLRAACCGDDEIGRLIGDFNEMLSRIQTRDQKLEELLHAQTEQRGFLQSIIDAVPDPILVVGMDRQLLLTNQAAGRLVAGGDRGTEVGERPEINNPLQEISRRREPVMLEQRITGADGQPQVVEISAAPLHDKGGSLSGIVEAIRDITERRRMESLLRENEQRLDHLAHHDALTDLPNRLLFQDRFEHAIHKARRGGTSVALLFLDLDRFKNINDTFGHEVGDELLKAVARRLNGCVRSIDTVARLGGDEFAVILEEIRDESAPSAVARKIIRALGDAFRIGEHELYIGTSIGISIYPTDGDSVETLIKNADSAMYHAKEEGRGGFQYFTLTLNVRAQRRLTIEICLRKALERGELTLHYQPQVDLKQGRVAGAEALLRWNSPELGALSPAEFIPVAEESGLIVPIGEWVLESACRQALEWERSGLPPLYIAVNLSARQFRHKDLVGSVARILAETGLAPSRLDLELTESILLGDSSTALDILSKFRDLGVNLSIDDFGTGYSSLSYLNRFPLDHLKVAQEFVRAIPDDNNSKAIARAIVVLAKNLGLKVIVEGVETVAQLRFFAAMGCEYVQGYLFSKPLPAEQFVGFLRQTPQPALAALAVARAAKSNFAEALVMDGVV